MITYLSILLIILILRLTFDWLWIKKYKTLKPLHKIIATGLCMIVAGTYLAFIVPDVKHFILWTIILTSAWSIVFDVFRNLINGLRLDYINENVWPDKFIYKYFNNFYLFTLFRIIVIVFFQGLI